MTTYYVRKTGSDGAGGTSPGAAWATIGKALGASGIASGDTVYIGAGVYREVVTVAMTSATVETFVIGDVDGSHTGDVGDIRITARTNGDTADATAASTIVLNGRDHLTFQNLLMDGGNSSSTGAVINGATATSTDITFDRCVFLPGSVTHAGLVAHTTAAGAASNWAFRRCSFLAGSGYWTYGMVHFTVTRHTVDYDMAITFDDCLLVGHQNAILVGSTGAGTGYGGGIKVRGCTLVSQTGVGTGDAFLSTTYPIQVSGCYIQGSYGLSSNAAGQIIEDHNFNNSYIPRTNVTAGTGSQENMTTCALLMEIGQGDLWGRTSRLYWSPMASSPMLGFGNGTGVSATDLLGAARPSGGSSALKAVGALERGNSFTRETTTVRSGANAISITGPGFQDFQLNVNATSITPTVYVRWDATYAGTKPAMRVLNGEECGVTSATATATGSSGAWEQLSLNFTPTTKGIVTIRFLSSDTNGGGKMFVDDFAT